MRPSQAAGEEIIVISGLRKRYRLGQISGGTLQGEIKERRERRRAKAGGHADDGIGGHAGNMPARAKGPNS